MCPFSLHTAQSAYSTHILLFERQEFAGTTETRLACLQSVGYKETDIDCDSSCDSNDNGPNSLNTFRKMRSCGEAPSDLIIPKSRAEQVPPTKVSKLFFCKSQLSHRARNEHGEHRRNIRSRRQQGRDFVTKTFTPLCWRQPLGFLLCSTGL